MKILVVDDDPIIREHLPAILHKAEFRNVRVANSARAALDILLVPWERFDCLLFDIEMPDINGIALCTRVRELKQFRYTPIIMITSRMDTAAIEQAFFAGANDYITKPLKIKDIRARMRVAERMMDSAMRAPRLNTKMALVEEERGVHEFSLQEAIHIEDVDRLIHPFSLGNYLSQLSRNSLDMCQVFAIKIDAVELLYKSCTSREFGMAISSVVRAMSNAIAHPQLLVAYNGGGVMLGILAGQNQLAWPAIERIIQQELEAIGLCHEDGCVMQIKLSMGRPFRPNASRTQRVKATFDRAIRRAATRQGAKCCAQQIRADSQPIVPISHIE